MTTISWAQRTGNQVIYAARALVHDTDASGYAVPVETVVQLYRHALLEVAAECNWKSDSRLDLSLAAGDYTKALPNGATHLVMNWSQAWWDEIGFVEKAQPETIRSFIDFDTSTPGGTVARGPIRMWSYEHVPGVPSAVTLLFYPAPATAGVFHLYNTEMAHALNDPTSTVPFDWAMTQLLETKLALSILSRFTQQHLQSLKIGPGVAEDLMGEYQRRLSMARIRSGNNRRVNRVVVRGR